MDWRGVKGRESSLELSTLKSYISMGYVVVMKNLDELYGSLYDCSTRSSWKWTADNTATCTMEKTSTVWKCIRLQGDCHPVGREGTRGSRCRTRPTSTVPEQIREVLPENRKHLVAEKKIEELVLIRNMPEVHHARLHQSTGRSQHRHDLHPCASRRKTLLRQRPSRRNGGTRRPRFQRTRLH